MGLVWVNQSLMYLCIPSKCNLLAALNCTGATQLCFVVKPWFTGATTAASDAFPRRTDGRTEVAAV